MSALLIINSIIFSGCGSGEKIITENQENSMPARKINLSTPVLEKNKEGLNVPEMQIDTSKEYIAILVSSEGDIKLMLNADKTPATVNNFVYLARRGFYNNTIFHRVINGFMIQGGDPNGDGSGGPGYHFDDEPFEGEYTRGVIAMANAGPNTNGSQFFIMHKDNEMPKNYVIFGKVLEGMDVVDKIASSSTTANAAGELSRPINPVLVNNVKIIEN